jgi:hypothetical protein
MSFTVEANNNNFHFSHDNNTYFISFYMLTNNSSQAQATYKQLAANEGTFSPTN